MRSANAAAKTMGLARPHIRTSFPRGPSYGRARQGRAALAAKAILRASAETLDFTRPTAVLLFGIPHFFSEDDDPAGIVRRLMSPLPPGSYVAITHLARDVAGDALTETFSRLNAEMAESVVLRTRQQVAALFGDLESIEPGVVQLPQWHPAPDAPAPGPLPMWCGVARKTANQF
ncbi:MAG TPA: SAM-dependent methyltransferase [Trebonia sp.]